MTDIADSLRPAPQTLDTKKHKIAESPHDKSPVRTMPDSGQKPHQKGIAVCLRRPFPASAKWNVNIIFKPA